MRLIHIILLLLYCHFTMAGAAGAWVMKQDLRTEERSALAVNDPVDLSDDADGSGDEGDDASSPGDPDHCHRAVTHIHIALLSPELNPVFSPCNDSKASLRPIDITTPPPRA